MASHRHITKVFGLCGVQLESPIIDSSKMRLAKLLNFGPRFYRDSVAFVRVPTFFSSALVIAHDYRGNIGAYTYSCLAFNPLSAHRYLVSGHVDDVRLRSSGTPRCPGRKNSVV